MSRAVRSFGIGAAIMLAVMGCSDLREQRDRRAASLPVCAVACNAAGAWTFVDGERRWVADIWMEPEGIYVRDRGREAVRFYEETATDNYRNADGERLEFETDDRMIRYPVSGEPVVQVRAAS